MDPQKVDKSVDLLGNRHCHMAAVALQVAINLSMLGAIPLNTTS
jgi:hypothetical protein